MISTLLTVRLRLAFGATSIVASVLMLAVLAGLVPDANQATVEGRASYANHWRSTTRLSSPGTT